MSAPDFLDSNILVYAYDSADRRKQAAAQKLVSNALSGAAVISVQVLAELSAILLYKATPKIRPEQVLQVLDALTPIPVIQPDARMVRRAVEAHAAYGIHFYDGMIVAAAERSGCARIWTEDLNPGQDYFGIPAANPFQEPES
jgi:predicted nucleic acid-binding protein